MARLFLLAVAAAAMAVSADAMKFTGMSKVDANGGLHAMEGENAGQCSAPTKGIGCFDAASSMQAGIDEMGKLGDGNDKTAAIMKDILTPILNFAVNAASGSAAGSMLQTGFCFGEFEGSEVTSARPGTVLGDHACNNIPLKTGENYLITSLGLPTLPFQAICPGDVNPGDLITFCTAYATCNGLPTLGFMISGSLIACALGNSALAGSTSGMSKAVSQAIKFGLNQVGFGFSLGADLSYSANVWDGDAMVDATVEGNYFDYVEIGFDPMADLLGLPKNVLAISGHQVRVVSIIGDAGDTVDALANSDSPQDAIATTVKNFAAVIELFAAVTIQLSEITFGALPDTPTMKFAQFAAVASAQPIEKTGVPEGFYATCKGLDIVRTLATEFFTFLGANIGGIIDSLLGEDAMENFLKAIAPTGDSDTIFAFAANKNIVGFFVQAPVGAMLLGPFSGDVAGMVSLACKVRNTDGHFSCEIDYKKPEWLSAFLDGAVFVAKAAQKFFDETGKVIAAVTRDVTGKSVSWTKDAIHKTGEDIKSGLVVAGAEIKDWAEQGGGYLFCGTQYVSDGAICGWDWVKNLCSGCSGCSGCGWGGCSGCSGCSGCFKEMGAKSCSIAKHC